MEKYNIDPLVQGSAPIFRFQLIIPEDVTTWTTAFYMNDATGNTVLTVNGSITANTIVANAALIGSFDVPLTANQTSALFTTTYRYSFWRTNVGFEDPLVSGAITVRNVMQ